MYSYPIIHHFDDVKDYINPEHFYIVDRGNHLIVNYMFASQDVFPNLQDHPNAMMFREFRGIAFDKQTGKILRRPLPKFFNLSERSEFTMTTVNFDSDDYEVFVKRDGTMIVPYKVSTGEIIWGTKLGQTEFSYDVAAFVKRNKQYQQFFEFCEKIDLSPIFEWTSPKNRVVIDYGSKEQLVLLAIRHKYIGDFVNLFRLEAWSNIYEIPLIETFTKEKFSQSLLDEIKNLQEGEGVCVKQKSTDLYFKVKADLYCQLHRVKSQITHERGIVELILTEKLDDLKPLICSDDLEKLNKYESEFTGAISETVQELLENCRKLFELETRKEQAKNIMSDSKLNEFSSIYFSILDLKDEVNTEKTLSLLKDYIQKNLLRETRFKEFRSNSSIFKTVSSWNFTNTDFIEE